MKEYPMLFSGPMVRAIIANRKHQTRRIMKNQPNIDPQTGDWMFSSSDGSQEVHPIEHWIEIQIKLHYPYGNVGDRLWVRETWAGHGDFDKQSPKVLSEMGFYGGLWYKADYPEGYDGPWDGYRGKWRPSIHMPRASSRILLEITDIRVEQLTYISEDDAIDEGIESFRPVPGDGYAVTVYRNYQTGRWSTSARYSFDTLWESIHGPKSFEANPWVWVTSFKRI